MTERPYYPVSLFAAGVVIRCCQPIGILVAQIALGAAAQEIDILDAITSSSQALTSYSSTIQMTRHETRGESVITFAFDFVPADRMSIV